ncbi:MAG: hypothetical protein HY737_04055 [Candidatus Omnitrophica bacterium]|nr:hypothetical protein [Candidatus Omnitrophota bacterium]
MALFKKSTRPTRDGDDHAVTETAPCEKSLRLVMSPQEVAPVRAAVLAEFQKEAALPGFRKGKAPVELVRRQYADAIQQELVQRLSRRALEQAAKAHQLKPVGPFEVKQVQLNDADGLTLEATVEVEPTFALGAYTGLPLTEPSLEVAAEELQRALASLQDSMAQLVPAGEGQPKERKVPPLDEAFAKDLGFDTVAKLTEHVEAKLREQKRAAQARDVETALCDELLARHAFAVPAKLVARQTEQLTRDFRVRLLLSGITEGQVEEELKKFTEQLRTSAARHVKLAFILDRIAEAEQIGVAEQDLVERLWRLSQRWKKDPADVRKIFDAQGLWGSVASAIRQEKTIELLKREAKITQSLNHPITQSPVQQP